MFRCKTAWFSNSVPQACRTFWISEGGSIAQWRTADYLFSEDATCPDTLRIFESKDYLWNKVTIFHSLFLSACQKRQSVKSLNIGHYVLPPASVQDGKDYLYYLVGRRRLCITPHFRTFPVCLPPAGYVRMDKLQKYSGDLCDFHHGSFQCFRCKALCCLPST
uniref:Telomere repeat binding bouquet formation protein 2 n=1 Tax=Amphilophus citrinellus TaxID=61819 RepID=A0A3Q0RBG9_AMPCI